MNLLHLSGLACLVLAFTGCATSKGSSGDWRRTGDPIVDGKAAISRGSAKDKTLWEYRTAAAALRRGEYGEAKSLLDSALITLGGITAGDKEAKKARGYFHEEARKTFHG